MKQNLEYFLSLQLLAIGNPIFSTMLKVENSYH